MTLPDCEKVRYVDIKEYVAMMEKAKNLWWYVLHDLRRSTITNWAKKQPI